jgi:hypothetical protein
MSEEALAQWRAVAPKERKECPTQCNTDFTTLIKIYAIYYNATLWRLLVTTVVLKTQ